MMAIGKSRSKSSEMAKQIERAWQSAAKDVANNAGSITAEELNEVLPMGVQQAENALAGLTVDSVLESEVTRDGDLAFKPLRFDVPDDDDPLTADRELEAEGYPVLDTYLNSSIKMKESHRANRPLIDMAPGHKLTGQYLDLHSELEAAVSKAA